jgi:branched-subunit amino acid ABC-type transport system permease component
MSDLLPYLIVGLVTGSLYGLAGLGLVLTYRTSGVFNFAHGAIAAAAAFLFDSLHNEHGWPWPPAALVTFLVIGIAVGVAMERVTRGLSEVPEAIVIVATVGIFLIVQGYLSVQYGNITKPFPVFLPHGGFELSGVTISWAQVISFAIATLSAAGLYLFLQSSRLGIAMRAVVDNPTLIGLTGERPARIRLTAWTIGSGFAAVSGILLAPTVGLDVTILTFLVIQAFGACAVGIFKSLPLTYAGGLMIGIVASVSTKYLTDIPFSGVPSTVPFLVLIAILLVIPARRLPARRRSALGALVAEHRSHPWPVLTGVGLVMAVLVALVPAFVGPKLPVWISALTYVVIFSSLSMLVWMSGQISLCHAAFVAVGVTTMSHLDGKVPWLVAVLLSGAAAVPIGALIAMPAVRISGIYLALLTLGFGVFMQNVIFPTDWMFSTTLTVTASRPRLGFIDGTSDKTLYYLFLVMASVVCALVAAISRGPLGRFLRAMSETPTMLSTHGLGVAMTRLLVLCLSAFLAGVGGALAITQSGAAAGIAYGPETSLLFLAVLAICGTRLLQSAVLAAVLMAVVPGYVTSFDQNKQILVFGLVALAAAMLMARRGQLHLWAARAAVRTSDRRAHGPATNRMRRAPRPAPGSLTL